MASGLRSNSEPGHHMADERHLRKALVEHYIVNDEIQA